MLPSAPAPPTPMENLKSAFEFITVRNSSCGNIMFSQVSICPQGGGVHPQADTPPGRHSPPPTVVAETLCFHGCLSVHRGEVYTLRQTPPRQTLPPPTVVAERLCFHRCLSVHRGEVYTPRQTHLGSTPPGDGCCSGRYSSYWNAFLFNHINRETFKLPR